MKLLLTAITLITMTISVAAQWVNHPTPGTRWDGDTLVVDSVGFNVCVACELDTHKRFHGEPCVRSRIALAHPPAGLPRREQWHIALRDSSECTRLP